METKLKSVFRNPRLQLAFKAAIFGLLLVFTHPLIFVAGAAVLYGRPLFRTLGFLEPFIILLAISLILNRSAGGGMLLYLSVSYSTFLFFLLLGVKNLVFVHRENWHRILNLALAYGAFLLFFYYNKELFVIQLILLFIVNFFLLRDLFKKRMIYWLLSLLVLEAAWGISLLPIGFINSANIAALVYFFLSNLALHYSSNSLTRKKILIDVTIFVLLFLAILAFSQWNL